MGVDFGYRGERLGLPKDGPGSVAPLGRRFGAIFIDWGLCALIAYQLIAHGNTQAANNWALIVFLTLSVLTVGTVGFTPGKRLLGLRVVAEEGGRLGIVRVAVRTRAAVPGDPRADLGPRRPRPARPPRPRGPGQDLSSRGPGWQEREGATRIMELASRRPDRSLSAGSEAEPSGARPVFWDGSGKLQDLGVFVAVVDEDIDNTAEDGEARMREKATKPSRNLSASASGPGRYSGEGGNGWPPGGQARYGYRIANEGRRASSASSSTTATAAKAAPAPTPARPSTKPRSYAGRASSSSSTRATGVRRASPSTLSASTPGLERRGATPTSVAD